MNSRRGVIDKLSDEAEDLGLTPGTPLFERTLRRLKVFKCRELKGIGDGDCSGCPANEDCSLYHEFRLDLRYPSRT